MYIKDPAQLPVSEEPFIVLCNQKNDLIGWLIDVRTDIKGIAPTDHAMLSKDPGRFVCQDFSGYHDIPMTNYMKPGSQMDFVTLVNNNPAFTAAFRASVDARLKAPFWEKGYDYIGIVGQAIGCPWLHTPGLRFCSVDVIRHLVNAVAKLPKDDQHIINNIPAESNPELFREIITHNPGTFCIKYSYDFDIAKTL